MFDLLSSRILVPTDFSEQSCEAVELALRMVARPDQLAVLHVAPPPNSLAPDPAIAWQLVSEEERTDELRKIFKLRFSEPKYSDVRFEVAFGAPAEEIVKFAEQDRSELIMLPSHGRTGLARLMIGSVAERVVRLAHCPVLVLRK